MQNEQVIYYNLLFYKHGRIGHALFQLIFNKSVWLVIQGVDDDIHYMVTIGNCCTVGSHTPDRVHGNVEEHMLPECWAPAMLSGKRSYVGSHK